MKPVAIDKLVYEQMFPKPKQTDPTSFHGLLQRSLIPEVRQETHAFYGHLDTQEAKYPGLDYSHPTHRIRLSRFPWHRRLFRAFDALKLTPSEIAALTKWEGTKWAKEKFEREQGVKIRDTTSDDFPDWVEPEDRPKQTEPARSRSEVSELEDDQVENDDDEDENMDDQEEEEEDDTNEARQYVDELASDDELDSVGVELNQRLRAQAARREAGDNSAVLDAEWEQWFKNVMESGALPHLSEQLTSHVLRGARDAVLPARVFPPEMISAARAGRWGDVPNFLHDVLMRTLEAEAPMGRSIPDDSIESRNSSGRSSRTASARTTPAATTSQTAAALAEMGNPGAQREWETRGMFVTWLRSTASNFREPGQATQAPGQPAAWP